MKSIYLMPGDERGEVQQRALKTFKFFLREQSWENRRIIPGLDIACIKIGFKTDKKPWFGSAPEVEHMWVSGVVFDAKSVGGVLQNKAKWVRGRKAGSDCFEPIEAFSDWMYVMNGRVYGGFSIDVMRQGMSAEERAQHDAAWGGLDFGEPGQILLAPELKRDDDGEMMMDDSLAAAYTYDKRKDLAAMSHPMDANMRESLHDALKEHPQMMSSVDDYGLSMLHQEAIAGNDNAVSVLLEHGVDQTTQTPHGHTAFDLAKMMGWPKVVDLLGN